MNIKSLFKKRKREIHFWSVIKKLPNFHQKILKSLQLKNPINYFLLENLPFQKSSSSFDFQRSLYIHRITNNKFDHQLNFQLLPSNEIL